jgi:hypothetical protein
MADGPIAPKQVQQTITRATRTFMRGIGVHMVPTSTLATAPNLASAVATPPTLHTVGVDQHSVAYTLPAIPLGGTYRLPFTIGLANLTSWGKSTTTSIVSGTAPQVSAARRALVTQAKDVVLFVAHLDGVDKNDPALTVVAQTCNGQGLSNGQFFAGDTLPTGRSYQAFSVTGYVTFSALAAYGGGSVTVHVSGSLHVQPG